MAEVHNRSVCRSYLIPAAAGAGLCLLLGGILLLGNVPNTHALPSSLATSTPSDHCVTIAYPQPINAFRAWIELGQPGELEFQNLAGPDGDGSKTKVDRQTLPLLVHVGDRFCAPGQYFYFSTP